MLSKQTAIEIMEQVFILCDPVLDNTVVSAYLYGSYARGDARKESDVNVLLTLKAEREQITACYGKIAETVSDLSLKYEVTVSVKLVPITEFMRLCDHTARYKEALQEGVCYHRSREGTKRPPDDGNNRVPTTKVTYQELIE